MLVTVIEAAMLVNRKKSAIYAWINEGKLAYQYDTDGTKKVDARELMKVEAAIRRGRPKGSASPPTTRREVG